MGSKKPRKVAKCKYYKELHLPSGDLKGPKRVPMLTPTCHLSFLWEEPYAEAAKVLNLEKLILVGHSAGLDLVEYNQLKSFVHGGCFCTWSRLRVPVPVVYEYT